MKFFRLTYFLYFLVTCANVSIAQTHYIDPINGSMQNDGSAQQPWSTLQEVVDGNMIETQSYNPLPFNPATSTLGIKNAGAPVQPGDTIVLLDGLHGEIFFRGAHNLAPITIMAKSDHTPIIRSIKLSSASNWRLINLTISGEPYGLFSGRLLFVESHGHHGPSRDVTIKGCNLYSIQDNTAWGADDWVANSASGIYVHGHGHTIEGNTLLNIDMGITILADSCQVINNSITNFSGDGIRPLGGYLLIENNVIKNCYDVDDNHDDGIQSFNLNAADFSHVVIRNNTIINYEDVNQRFRGTLQGIGCFDGPFHNWVIENNVIAVDHYHGISLYGAFDCDIINNTVIDVSPDETPGPVWIRVNPHKDGTPSERCRVINNLTNRVIADDQEVHHNVNISALGDYNANFIDFQAFDLHLSPESIAIDQGLDSLASESDRDGRMRPQGESVDVGAYEYAGNSSILNQDLDDTSITIFPNPCTTDLFIFCNSVEGSHAVQIIDIKGYVYMPTVERLNTNSYRVDVSNLAAGTYVFRIGDRVGKNFIKK